MKNIKTEHRENMDKAAVYMKKGDENYDIPGNITSFSDLCRFFAGYEFDFSMKKNESDNKSLDTNFDKDDFIINMPFFKMIIDTITDLIVFLDDNRRIVFANKAFCDFTSMDHHKTIGLRLGEALGCAHAYEEAEGCGSTKFCRECGAAKAISSSLGNNISSSLGNKCYVQECRIIPKQEGGDFLDLQVKSVPFKIKRDKYIFLVITDISHEKRRRALERIFFHDILNLTGNIQGLTELITSGYAEKRRMYEELLLKSARMLVEEIHSHRILFAAESNVLTVDIDFISSLDILKEVRSLYENHYVAKDKNLIVDKSSVNVDFESDKNLLMRVLGNMIKNAFEASGKGETVTIGCGTDGKMIMFWVNNPGVIPCDVRLQIFQRSFSTKGKGRGLGTYSIRLLTERYLKGLATFSTSESQGTTFRVFYPVKFHKDDGNDK